MRGDSIANLPGHTGKLGVAGPMDIVSLSLNSLGYCLYSSAAHLPADVAIKLAPIDGVAPDERSIREKQYPAAAQVYAVTRKVIGAETPASRVRAWLLSDEGQRMVAECGYVPVRPVN
jgi:phosphate transport system substrate-binding protein